MNKLEKLLTLRNQIKTGYSRVMGSYGLISVNPEPLIPTKDQSILFTNSTIVPLKDIFLDREYTGNGHYLIQKCLRLRSLHDYAKNISVPKHVSCFEMLGSLVPVGKINIALESVLEFLESVVGISKKELVVLIPSNCPEDWRTTFSRFGLFSQMTRPYEWKYGMDGVAGSGVAFAVKKTETSFDRIGNFVAMYHSNKLEAYEFGFGVEPLIGKGLLKESSFDGSIQFQVINSEKIQNVHSIADLVGIVSAMYFAGVNKKDYRSRWFLLTQSVRELIVVCLKEGVALDELITGFLSFNSLYFGNAEHVDSLVVYLQKRWEEISAAKTRFNNWLRSQQGLYYQGKISSLKFKEIDSVLSFAEDSYLIPRDIALSMVLKYEPWLNQEGGA